MRDGIVVGDATAPATKTTGPRRVPGAPALRRDLSDDFAGRRSRVAAASESENEDEHYVVPRRFSGLRFRLKGGVPRSVTGRVVAGVVVLGALAGFTAVLWEARVMLLHDPRMVIASSSSVQITGNNHMTRAQLLSVFGGDVDRNILTVPLTGRRAELESLPWVEHATVMRLLPNKMRVAIVERTPVAFVRQGSHIGLVDGNGVLLDMEPGDGAAAGEDATPAKYSFPVVTGLQAEEPLSTRAARMKLYGRFTSELDAGGGTISKNLSEVDLSSPEDVKALIPVGGADVLVHFGDDDFLRRYKKFEANLPGWRSQYPKLASVDMRYERQVVLEMQPGSAVPVAGADAAAAAADAKAASVAKIKPVVSTKPVPAKAVVAKPVAKASVVSAPVTVKAPAAGGTHLQTAFDVHAGAAKTPAQGDPR